MMTGKYAKVPCISAMHNCLASALRGIRQGPAWHYARHLCMAKYRSRYAQVVPQPAGDLMIEPSSNHSNLQSETSCAVSLKVLNLNLRS